MKAESRRDAWGAQPGSKRLLIQTKGSDTKASSPSSSTNAFRPNAPLTFTSHPATSIALKASRVVNTFAGALTTARARTISYIGGG